MLIVGVITWISLLITQLYLHVDNGASVSFSNLSWPTLWHSLLDFALLLNDNSTWMYIFRLWIYSSFLLLFSEIFIFFIFWKSKIVWTWSIWFVDSYLSRPIQCIPILLRRNVSRIINNVCYFIIQTAFIRFLYIRHKEYLKMNSE